METLITQRFSDILREHGHRATPGRLSLLQVLHAADAPLAIPEILKRLKGAIDQATIYRALESLSEVGIVRRVDMHHAHAHYELTTGSKHHHHLICKQCGKIEDVKHCDVSAVEAHIIKKSKSFRLIEDHSLEFFGICKTCARNTLKK